VLLSEKFKSISDYYLGMVVKDHYPYILAIWYSRRFVQKIEMLASNSLATNLPMATNNKLCRSVGKGISYKPVIPLVCICLVARHEYLRIIADQNFNHLPSKLFLLFVSEASYQLNFTVKV
jgi:hypothetical protein